MENQLPSLLFDIANDLLDRCVLLIREAGLDDIDRVFVNTGDAVIAPVEFGPATSQLTVTVGPIMPDLITDFRQRREGRASSGHLWKAQYAITLLRPFPMTGSNGEALPPAEDLHNAAEKHLNDGWCLARGLAYHWMKGNLVPSYTFTVENMQWAAPSFTQVGPNGGIAGWSGKFTVSVHDHYEPELLTP